MRIDTNDSEFHELERIADTGRGDLVKVRREALRHLLRDHMTLLEKARGRIWRGGKGHPVEVGEDQESLL